MVAQRQRYHSRSFSQNLATQAGFFARSVPAFWDQYKRERQRPVEPAPLRPEPARWPDTGLHAAWLGHTSVLLKIDGYTILTDPVLGEYCGVDLRFTQVGLKRLVAPALLVNELPSVDLILLSHAHMDHCDLPTLRRLANPKTTIVTAHRTADLLQPRHYRAVRELGWGEECRVGPAQLRALEVNHWGARYRTDNYRGFNGYTLQIGQTRVLFGGDTATTDLFRAAKTSRPYDLAIMPIGAYNPWVHYHCTPEQAWRMALDAGADRILPVHHQTFRLSREPYNEPIERLQEIVGADQSKIVLQTIGEEFSLG